MNFLNFPVRFFPIITSANLYRVKQGKDKWIYNLNFIIKLLKFCSISLSAAASPTCSGHSQVEEFQSIEKFFYPVSQKFGFFENICLAMGSSIKDISFWRKWGVVKCQKTSLKKPPVKIYYSMYSWLLSTNSLPPVNILSDCHNFNVINTVFPHIISALV